MKSILKEFDNKQYYTSITKKSNIIIEKHFLAFKTKLKKSLFNAVWLCLIIGVFDLLFFTHKLHKNLIKFGNVCYTANANGKYFSDKLRAILKRTGFLKIKFTLSFNKNIFWVY